MARSPSNKGITNRNSAVPPAGRNYQDTTQAVRRIPGVAYGEQQDLIQQQQAAPLPKDTLPKEQPQVQAAQRQMPNIDVFAPTERPNEPVTSGLPFGPGLNTRPEEQIYQAENIKQFVYQSWLETGDDSLLEYL
mgnify:FL=1|jgi:hypothetical protein|tara:strand:- start:630 stop:1031 length:402 start_codon:yes stop_codon:yes gene_type:complete